MADASTTEEINAVIDKPVNMYIVNGCGWSITQPILPTNKLSFLQHLLLDEVIMKRERNLKAFASGLNVLGLADVIKVHPQLTRKIFVMESAEPLTPAQFLGLIGSVCPEIEEQVQAYQFFIEFVPYLHGKCTCVTAHMVPAVCIRIGPYIRDCLCCGNPAMLMLCIYFFLERMTAGLEALLEYITSLPSIPPMGLQIPIQLEYLRNEKDSFPESGSMFQQAFPPYVPQREGQVF